MIQPDYHVNVIGHDDVFLNFGSVADIFFRDNPVRFWDDVGIVPYGGG